MHQDKCDIKKKSRDLSKELTSVTAIKTYSFHPISEIYFVLHKYSHSNFLITRIPIIILSNNL